MIEKNQFHLWVVTGPFGIYGIPFQTYGTALRYVCDDAQSTDFCKIYGRTAPLKKRRIEYVYLR